MPQVRVDQITRAKVAEQIVNEDRQQRVHLFTHSRFESQRATFAGIGKQDLSNIAKSSNGDQQKSARKDEDVDETLSVKLKSGDILEMPRLSKEQLSDIDAILSQATPAQAEHLVRSGQIYGTAAYQEIDQGREDGPYSLTATSAARTTYEAYVATTVHRQQEDKVHGSVLLGMYGVELNLKNYFQKVQDGQDLAAELRTDAAELEEALADWPDDGSTEMFSYREVQYNEDGSYTVVDHKNVEMTKAEAKALLDKLKGHIASLGQFEQRQMAQLQMMVNRYQQAMNTLSNIMKNMSDTHKAIIGNVK